LFIYRGIASKQRIHFSLFFHFPSSFVNNLIVPSSNATTRTLAAIETVPKERWVKLRVHFLLIAALLKGARATLINDTSAYLKN